MIKSSWNNCWLTDPRASICSAAKTAPPHRGHPSWPSPALITDRSGRLGLIFSALLFGRKGRGGQNENYLDSYVLGFGADVDEKEMDASESKAKFARVKCYRKTFMINKYGSWVFSAVLQNKLSFKNLAKYYYSEKGCLSQMKLINQILEEWIGLLKVHQNHLTMDIPVLESMNVAPHSLKQNLESGDLISNVAQPLGS